METFINIHIEKLPEGVYLATSAELQGLVAQGRTLTETLEIARDVARKLMEAQLTRPNSIPFPAVPEVLDYPLVVSH
jgi:predicted RNase H-like HicB family nuclease